VSNKKGLTVVSQRKYVIFYEELWRQHWGVKGDIGQVPGGSPIAAIPVQPTFRLFGIEILYCNIPLRNCRIVVYKGSYLTPALIWDSGFTRNDYKQSFDCDCTLQGNLKIHVQFKKSFFSTKPTRLFDLWHNTLFMERNQPTMDFMQDQLDMKRTTKAIVGPRVILRLRFSENSLSGAPPSFSKPAASGGGSSPGYELVSSVEDRV
jgi:hypothetical protein